MFAFYVEISQRESIFKFNYNIYGNIFGVFLGISIPGIFSSTSGDYKFSIFVSPLPWMIIIAYIFSVLVGNLILFIYRHHVKTLGGNDETNTTK